MKQFIPFALLLIFLISCNKDDDQVKLSNNCNLTRIDVSYPNHAGFYLFSYNSAGYVSEMMGSTTDSTGFVNKEKYFFTYNANNQIIKEEVFHTNPATNNYGKSSETIFKYTNNLLNTSLTTYPNSSSTHIGQKQYIHDSQGRIESATFLMPVGRPATDVYSYDSNGNLINITRYFDNNPIYISEFRNYDNHPNLFATLKGLYRPHDNKLFGLGSLMQNNPGVVKYWWQLHSNNGSMVYGVDDSIYINYLYGQNGLPTVWNQNNVFGGETAKLTYDCK